MKTMKKTARLLTAFLLALTLMAAELSPALAVTQADIDALKNDAADLTSQRKELESKLSALKDDKSQAMAKKKLLDEKIANTAAQIKNVEAQIADYTALIVQTEAELLLLRLPEQDRAMFHLRYMEGYTAVELAQMFDLPSGTVRAKLSRSRKLLKLLIEEK